MDAHSSTATSGAVFSTPRTIPDIWSVLARINVNDHVEKKQGFSYLSWAWAWGVLMEHFPDSKFSFERFQDGGEVFRYPDGSAEVRCALTINGITRTMWLPVMDHRNNAIKNPDARAVNDAKMRCLVKAMALFGLGHYIYAGEDLPDPAKTEAPAAPAAAAASDPVKELHASMTNAKTLDELKAAFTKASKYARNRNDEQLLKSFTALKDELKGKLK